MQVGLSQAPLSRVPRLAESHNTARFHSSLQTFYDSHSPSRALMGVYPYHPGGYLVKNVIPHRACVVCHDVVCVCTTESDEPVGTTFPRERSWLSARLMTLQGEPQMWREFRADATILSLTTTPSTISGVSQLYPHSHWWQRHGKGRSRPSMMAARVGT